jgi:hypothetical protein
MAKAKRERRTSIRTMSADASALEALERAERSAEESAPEPPEGEPAAASSEAAEKD